MKVPVPPQSAAGMPDFRVECIAASMLLSDAMNVDGLDISLQPSVMANAELWWVDRDSTALVRDMSIGCPADATGDGDLLPVPFGMLVFAEPIGSGPLFPDDDDEAALLSISMIVWHRQMNPDTGLCSWALMLWGSAFEPDGSPLNGYTPNNFAPFVSLIWRDGQTVESALNEDEQWCRGFPWLMSVMALAREPRLATTTDEEPDRASRRRAKRAGIDLGATRVIYARPSIGGHAGSGEGHAYKHRWIVSGHWRSQPYGEGMKLRRPVYIAPHVKGPDGAPLLHGEKVRAIVGER